MARLAAVLIFFSQVLLLFLVFEPTGETAILFEFVGTPLLAVGVVLAFVALMRRLAREAAAGSE